MHLHHTVHGSGPAVVLVHGSLTTSARAWERQLPLAERWSLVVPDRRGYAPNPPAPEGSDCEIDGRDIAPLLGDGAHLVGHSYGALGAMFAAGLHPDAVRSLTLIEAPPTRLARGHELVEAQITLHQERVATIEDPREFYLAFLSQLGAPVDSLPDPLPEKLEREVRLVMRERYAWEAPVPFDAVRAGAFPTLVVTGGWDEALDVANDELARGLGAQRVVITGRGHVVQRTGAPFNEALERFLLDAEATQEFLLE